MSSNLFPNLQCGLSKGLGACDALLTITNFVQKALVFGCEVCMVSPDFSAASNGINQKAPISQSRQLGVGGPFLSILIESLSNRLQGLLLIACLLLRDTFVPILLHLFKRLVYVENHSR